MLRVLFRSFTGPLSGQVPHFVYPDAHAIGKYLRSRIFFLEKSQEQVLGADVFGGKRPRLLCSEFDHAQARSGECRIPGVLVIWAKVSDRDDFTRDEVQVKSEPAQQDRGVTVRETKNRG